MRGNRNLLKLITLNQQFAQKDIVFYLNCMKIVFSGYRSPQEIMNMNDKDLG